MVLGEGTATDDPVQAVKDVYAQGGPKDGDEFLKPIIVGGDERRLKGSSSGSTCRCALTDSSLDDDTVLFFNYRSGTYLHTLVLSTTTSR